MTIYSIGKVDPEALVLLVKECDELKIELTRVTIASNEWESMYREVCAKADAELEHLKSQQPCGNVDDDMMFHDAVGYCVMPGTQLYIAAGAQPLQQTLTEDQIKTEFGKLYPNDIGILELAENNHDFALEAIGARHHWAAFLAGARAIEAKLHRKRFNKS
jgi:hypothetical protein